MNDLGTPDLGEMPAPSVFELIPGRDHLVVFDDGVIPLPDAEVLEELEIQADQRCAAQTLGGVSDALLTVAEAAAGNVLTTVIEATYPALGRYLGRVKELLHHPRSLPAGSAGRSETAGEAEAARQTPEPAQPQPAPQVARRTRIALETTVGAPAEEPDLRRDPETNALRARVRTSTGLEVEVRAEPTGRVICITVDEA